MFCFKTVVRHLLTLSSLIKGMYNFSHALSFSMLIDQKPYSLNVEAESVYVFGNMHTLLQHITFDSCSPPNQVSYFHINLLYPPAFTGMILKDVVVIQ